MQFISAERRLRLSVREFAEFRIGVPPRQRGSGHWRAQVGTAAHQRLREEPPPGPGELLQELTVAGTLMAGRWQLELHGRVDRVLVPLPGSSEPVLLEEYKTASLRLPLEVAELESIYPEYFDQLAAYLVLASFEATWRGRELRGCLLVECLEDGFRQQVLMDLEEARRRVARRSGLLEPYLEQSWEHTRQLQTLEVPPAFSQWRQGQPEALSALRRAMARQAVVAMQAPTGFGKTGVALQLALEALRDGLVRRIIYLTGKSTGQLAALRQLRQAMPPRDTGLAVLQLRSRAEHARVCPLAQCDGGRSCRPDPEQPPMLPEQPWGLLRDGSPDMDDLVRVAAEAQMCPYELRRCLLPYADVWVCDYNYLWASGPSGLLAEVPGYAPQETFLLIDEAHNLPSRVADACSFVTDAASAHALALALEDAGGSAQLRLRAEAWAGCLEGLSACERLSPNDEYTTLDTLEQLVEGLKATALDWDSLATPLAELASALPLWLKGWQDERLERLCWVPRGGSLEVRVLDAGPLIAEVLGQFRSSLLMSATLHPWRRFCETLGAPQPEPLLVEGRAPWRETAYEVAIDATVDTRLKRRSEFYAVTAQTLAVAAQQGPVAVFFSSYQYAETLRTYVDALGLGLQIAVQPRRADLSGQLQFIDESLLTAHLLFFVLGSSFSEGVDHLGGRVERAVVVGPALPEVNAVQQARMEACHRLGRSQAFEQVYLEPALRKINQALGRLVRGPGQRAQILLHGQRFTDPRTQALLLPEYRSETVLRTRAEVADWWR